MYACISIHTHTHTHTHTHVHTHTRTHTHVHIYEMCVTITGATEVCGGHESLVDSELAALVFGEMSGLNRYLKVSCTSSLSPHTPSFVFGEMTQTMSHTHTHTHTHTHIMIT